VLIALAAISLSGGVLAATVGHSQDDSGGPAAIVEDLDAEGPRSPFKGAVRPKAPPADFALRDQDGRPAALAAYRGRPVIVTFMYSTCKDTCPLMADQIRGALDELGHDVPTLAVSVDPAGDTPLNTKRFLARHGLTGRARFLRGTRAQLAPVWRAYGIRPQTNSDAHSAYVLVIDKRGRQRAAFPASELTPEGLAHDVKALQAEQIRSPR
jgi:protein SCO1